MLAADGRVDVQRPCGVGAHHRVQDGQEFSRAGDERGLFRFPRLHEARVEAPDAWVVSRGDERPHAEHRAHRGAAALHDAASTQGTGVATERRDGDQLRHLATRQTPELQQIAEQRARQHRPDARDAAEQRIAFAPHGTLLHEFSQIGVREAQFAFEIRNVRRKTLAHAPFAATEDLGRRDGVPPAASRAAAADA